MKTSDRFSNRVENYIKYRPRYPETMLEVFRQDMRLKPSSVVADIGCGPGQSSQPFLEYGCRVFGVEPNKLMRRAAEDLLSEYRRFSATDGNAHETGLEESSIDVVIAAQAFHWFSDDRTVEEFGRILKPKGYAALIWNERKLDETPFLRDYESLLLEYGTDYESVRHDVISVAELKGMFGRDVRVATYQNVQTFDFEGVKGRLLSSSYTPAEDDPSFEPMLSKLRSVFAEHNENGRIQILYDTNVFYLQY
ncbi:MAG: class I SAM-dependent methyltransferase [Acidobacteria bacterium]|nr:MAG: class I SAM-dependent methyltransferase [Acidobacteriota bacterium]REK02047.1 MAG: class I SAM-dependent methyltransferase [Acidobacteriota bacterium]REK15005.1 MAG: class I SAM-dependent methyltransferase [Acidobacteriota bacterium]REK45719.1 MAG: class I SAM-dependent methyltransferase [Acidobacteriota bacterium]